jgi:hypothetical protein
MLIRLIHVVCILGSVLCALPQNGTASTAQSLDPGTYAGFWELPEPAGDTCVLIIKRGGEISSFWAGSGISSILKGRWQWQGTDLEVQWDSGERERLRLLGDNAIQRHSISRPEQPAIRGIRVDTRRPGSLTVPREQRPATPGAAAPENTETPHAAPAFPQLNTFTGYWKVRQAGGLLGGGRDDFYLHLQRNGQVSAALRTRDLPDGQPTQWRLENGRVLITWPSGHRDMLRDKGDGTYELLTFNPRNNSNDRPNSTLAAEKVPASDAARYFQAGDFQLLTVVDIRGTWVPLTPGEQRRYIEIEGWGNAFRFPSAIKQEGTDPGTWRLLSDRVVITWVDSSRDVIRIGEQHYIQESYAPGEPITGTPLRSSEVRKVNERPIP